MLREAGWVIRDNVLVNRDTGKPFTLGITTVLASHERVAMPYINSLKRLGIKTRVRTVKISQYINRMGTFDFEMTLTGYRQNLVPGIELRNYWGSYNADREFGRNVSGIKSPVVDYLIEKVLGARNRAELITAAHALDRVMLWNFYFIPTFWPPAYRYGYWNKFSKPKVQSPYRTGFFDTWWVDKEKAEIVRAARENIRR